MQQKAKIFYIFIGCITTILGITLGTIYLLPTQASDFSNSLEDIIPLVPTNTTNGVLPTATPIFDPNAPIQEAQPEPPRGKVMSSIEDIYRLLFTVPDGRYVKFFMEPEKIEEFLLSQPESVMLAIIAPPASLMMGIVPTPDIDKLRAMHTPVP